MASPPGDRPICFARSNGTCAPCRRFGKRPGLRLPPRTRWSQRRIGPGPDRRRHEPRPVVRLRAAGTRAMGTDAPLVRSWRCPHRSGRCTQWQGSPIGASRSPAWPCRLLHLRNGGVRRRLNRPCPLRTGWQPCVCLAWWAWMRTHRALIAWITQTPSTGKRGRGAAAWR